MNTANEILREDMAAVLRMPCIPWEKLTDSRVLITGATGLIGSNILQTLICANGVKNLNVKILALVRDAAEARAKFSDLEGTVNFLQGTMERLPYLPGNITHIIHCASPTASGYFAQFPVETVKTAVNGTMNLLDWAKENSVEGFVYLSSMEAYGAPHTDDVLLEDGGCNINTMSPRSCYPEAKRMCECLCAAYAAEYGVPAMSVRLAQTFGPGVSRDDKRVFAEFARCAEEGRDIVLKTTGESKRCYIYTADAVSAILTVLLRGEAGQVYNAANPATYCSVYEMAQMVARELAGGRIDVRIQPDGNAGKLFPPAHHLNLSVGKIKALGWQPTADLPTMYRRMMAALK